MVRPRRRRAAVDRRDRRDVGVVRAQRRQPVPLRLRLRRRGLPAATSVSRPMWPDGLARRPDCMHAMVLAALLAQSWSISFEIVPRWMREVVEPDQPQPTLEATPAAFAVGVARRFGWVEA